MAGQIYSHHFGWSYVLMPGLQLADPQVRGQLPPLDQQAIAAALGKNVASMQQAKWPFAGRYRAATDAVEPFELPLEPARWVRNLDALELKSVN